MGERLNTDELVQLVHERLDYSVDYEERCKIIEEIDRDFGVDINELYSAYGISNSKTFANEGIMSKLNSLFDTMSNYLLMAEVKNETKEQKENKSEYPYKDQADLKDGKSDRFLCLEDFVHALKASDYENVFETKTKIKDLTVQYVIDNIKDCPYITDYIEYEEFAMSVIKCLESQYELKLKQGLEPDDIVDLKWVNPRTKRVYYYTAQEYFILRKSVGYTGHNCRELNQDVIAVFKAYHQPFSAKRNAQEFEIGRKIDIDFFDEEHVRGLLLNCCLTGWNDRFDYFVGKLDKLVESAGLSDVEMQVYRLLRTGREENFGFADMEKQKFTQTEIGKILGVARPTVSKCIDRIVGKVIMRYEVEFEDYYYTFLVKGKYKTCKKCKKNKLENPDNFRFRPNRNKYDSICSNCR